TTSSAFFTRRLTSVNGKATGGQAHVVELYISYLRKKIDAGRPPMIHTVRGAGYVIKAPVS
ncbi:winged helix-turn-helix domain-containing protein, partial [Kitasatospora sp. NPDC047058]|uniref:winged helix-turn-helix domain-containing protein n=1 Tax=Kitasatospora sp. NPDC047058 TaxID=3155620 RepID=UPI00340CDA45